MEFQQVNISEVFCSIDGEGVRAGRKAIFIRFAGCNVHCKYCDTAYALSKSQANSTYKTTYDVYTAVLGFCTAGVVNNITITGGEPLLYPKQIMEILELLNQSEYAFSINIETNGTISPEEFLGMYQYSKFRCCIFNDLFFTFDIKTPAAGEDVAKKCVDDKNTPIFVPAMEKWLLLTEQEWPLSKRYNNVIKAVVGSIADLDYVRNIFEDAYTWHRQQYRWYISPVFGAIDPADIVEYMLTHDSCASWIMQLQMHKLIWDKDKRGV